jgi:sortase A
MRRLLAVLLCSLVLAPVASVDALTLDGFRGETPSTKKKDKAIGRIIIPRLGVNEKIYMGITDRQFDIGVGKWPGTPAAGDPGNIVIGGHRTVAKRPFYNIEKLRRGDVITVVEGTKRVRYKVTNRMIVKPNAIWVTKQSTDATLTLFSCHPKGSVKQRYIVRATLMT